MGEPKREVPEPYFKLSLQDALGGLGGLEIPERVEGKLLFNAGELTPKQKILKENIQRRLKSFSQIQTEYYGGKSIDIYRTARRRYFSEQSARCGLMGVPLSRPTTRPDPDDIHENTEKDEDRLEPLWFSTELTASEVYFRSPDYATYAYHPLMKSSIKGRNLLFLDLTDPGFKEDILGRTVYRLDIQLMRPIYEEIFSDFGSQVQKIRNERYFCVDSPPINSFKMEQIYSAFGYYDGFRNSDMYIDRFVTLELFHIIKKLGIESDKTVVMGYYHPDVITGRIITGEIDGEPIPYIVRGKYFPAEFAIRHGCTINKNYLCFKGEPRPKKTVSSSRILRSASEPGLLRSASTSDERLKKHKPKGGTKKKKHRKQKTHKKARKPK